ncbi:S-adenosyl-L-methionine-dependent methyltransferase [Schizothecium vesticola]|uniref:S-adenosyl-L-methionine-dependent methyltransferase n=1 Tax=Schizothecium vesticola TaxID=314040 RepID=A0AA40F4X3_9PEZI|nr:S-adenosyl-L-methionine-dependent methyltransferase [Schizothecium vesticola]
MAATDKKQYNSVAQQYDSVEDLPCSKIEAELIRTALGDCTGLAVLDLGGGTGLHARRAIDDANAAAVDVVDISCEMLRIGEAIEAKLGRRDRIRWLEADAARPLGEQIGESLRPGGYEVVMANWVFDHATSMADLKAMWENIAANLKPGGRFLGVRVWSLQVDYMKPGKYGATFSNMEEIPGGWKYRVGFLTSPAFEFGCTSMTETLEMVDTIPRELGLVDWAVVPAEEAEVVKGDFEFWADFVEEPNLAVLVARKA